VRTRPSSRGTQSLAALISAQALGATTIMANSSSDVGSKDDHQKRNKQMQVVLCVVLCSGKIVLLSSSLCCWCAGFLRHVLFFVVEIVCVVLCSGLFTA